jgi:hypothetical protein
VINIAINIKIEGVHKALRLEKEGGLGKRR